MRLHALKTTAQARYASTTPVPQSWSASWGWRPARRPMRPIRAWCPAMRCLPGRWIGVGRPADRHGHLPVHRHRGQHAAVGSSIPTRWRMRSPATKPSCARRSNATRRGLPHGWGCRLRRLRPCPGRADTPHSRPSARSTQSRGTSLWRRAIPNLQSTAAIRIALRVRMAVHTGVVETRGGRLCRPRPQPPRPHPRHWPRWPDTAVAGDSGACA